MNDNTANTAPALQAVKQPLWMSCATEEELNAYLKRQKTSSAKAFEIRGLWNAQHIAARVETPTEVKPQDEATPVVDQPRQRTTLEDFAAKGNAAQSAVDAIIAKAKAPVAVAASSLEPHGRKGLVTRYIDPTMVDVKDGWNARIDFGDLEELADQIKPQKALDGHGLLNDIRVQDKGDGTGRYWLVDGERRYQAVMGLIDQGEFFEFGIPAKVEPADAKVEDLIVKMFLANEGKKLLPYEEGLYFKRLRDEFGMTAKVMEEVTGRSDSSIWYALALTEADEDLVDAIRKGTVGTTIAKTIAVNARGNKARQKELVARAKEVKKTGDKKALAQLKKDIDSDRRAKIAKERPGLKLKARKADEAEIAQLGTNVGMRLKEVMEKLGLDHDTDLSEWVGKDRELQVAANFGALQALKAIMGMKVKVEF